MGLRIPTGRGNMMALFYMDDKYISDHPPVGETCVCVSVSWVFLFHVTDRD